MDNSLKKFLEPKKVFHPAPTNVKSRGSTLTEIRAYIFDIYGTLLISASGDVGTAVGSGSAAAFRSALTAAGLADCPPSFYEKIKENFFRFIEESHRTSKEKGYPYPEVDIIKIWSKTLNKPETAALFPEITQIEPKTAATAYESIVNPVYPMPGMFELLRHPLLKGAELGIISNAQFYTSLIFDYISEGGLRSLGFNSDLCLFSYIQKRAKPDLKLFEELSERLAKRGISPSQTVYIGNDMLNDIMPAALSGYRTILFAGDRRSLRLRSDHDACKDIKPDVIVNNLIEIIDYIQEG